MARAGAVGVVCASGWGGAASGPVGAAIGISCGIAAVAAWIDVVESRLPDRLVALAAAPVLVLLLAKIVRSEPSIVGLALLGVVVVAFPLLILHIASPDSLGFGDVKLGAVLGANLGLVDPRWGLVALCVASGVTAIAGIAMRRRALPFGPGLVLGTACAFLLAGLIGWETQTW
jgi:leader peptidase (prepilin peptidase)/N-methyltransferase